MSVKIQEKHAKQLLTACGIPSDDAEPTKLKGRLESLPELAKEADFTRPEGSLEKRLLKQVLDAAAHGKEIELVNGNGNGHPIDKAVKNGKAPKEPKAEKAAKPAKSVKAPKKEKAPRKNDNPMSMLDACAKVLGKTSKPMTSKELVEKMAEKGYWKSPGGATPHGTVHHAISAEIKVKGKESRFIKADHGQFSLSK